MDNSDKQIAIKKLHEIAERAERNFIPEDNFKDVIKKEKDNSWKYGGKTVFDDAKPPRKVSKGVQLRMF